MILNCIQSKSFVSNKICFNKIKRKRVQDYYVAKSVMIKQLVVETAPNKAAAIQPPTAHHENYQN